MVVCPDSFKGSLSAIDAAEAISEGILLAVPDAVVDAIPLADGGEGTVAALVDSSGGQIVPATVTGPLGRAIDAFYGVIDDGNTAVVEMAAAAGLDLVPLDQRDPTLTTTRGVGELILDAYSRGCRRFVIGIGGSATNDGGAGAMSALGVRFLDADGKSLPDGGGALTQLASIDTSKMLIDPREISVQVACDVTNPLTGPMGASAVYGPQKGATPSAVDVLDAALANYARVILRDVGVDVEQVPGGGAAGGMGAGLMAFLRAKLESGIDIVLGVTHFDERVRGADLVFTGEGRVDGQTAYGKTISGVLSRCRAAGVPVVILAGSIGDGADALYDLGATALFSIASGPISIDECIAYAPEYLRRLSRDVTKLYTSQSA